MIEKTNSPTLRLFIGEEYQVRVETRQEMSNSPFAAVYEKAIEEVKDIVKRQEDWNKIPEIKKRPFDANNVVAFTGNRGSGKTSAMLSVCGFLEEDGAGNGVKFVVHPTIDPGSFEPAESIVGTLVSSLYYQYTNDKKLAEKEEGKRRKLEIEFQKVLMNVQMLHKHREGPFGDPREQENPYSVLDRLSSTSQLKSNIQELIKLFLEVMYEAEATNMRLLIPIDDLDLNMEHAYALAEDLRKYLIQPNIIILVALRLEQLREAVEEKYIGLFRDKLENQEPAERKDILGRIEKMSLAYLEKIFPSSRSITMPELTNISWARSKHNHVYIGTRENYALRGEIAGGADTLEIALLKTIAEHTGVVMIKPGEFIHPMVPLTLRELHNFVAFLDRLPERNSVEGKLNALEEFRSYFITYWVGRTFPQSIEKIINDLTGTAYEIRNKRVVEELVIFFKNIDEELVGGHPTEWSDDENEYSRINHRGNLPGNVSIGDWQAAIHMYERYSSRPLTSLIRFCISTLYTIDIQRELLLEEHKRLKYLVGGSWFNPVIEKIIPSRFGPGNLQYRPFNDLPSFFAMLSPDSKKTNLENSKPASEAIAWFGHFLSFGQVAQNRFRASKEIYYNLSLSSNQGGGQVKNGVFDMFAFLFWYLIPEENFKRFSNLDDKLRNEYVSEEIFGKPVEAAFIAQMEVIDYISKNLRAEIEAIAKNRIIGNRGEWKLIDEIDAMCIGIERLLKNVEIIIDGKSLDEHWRNWKFWVWFRENRDKNTYLMELLSQLDHSLFHAKQVKTVEEQIHERVIDSSKRSLLGKLISVFERSNGKTKKGDKTKGKARKLLIEFGEFMNESQKIDLQEALTAATKEWQSIPKRNYLSEVALKIAKSLHETIK